MAAVIVPEPAISKCNVFVEVMVLVDLNVPLPAIPTSLMFGVDK